MGDLFHRWYRGYLIDHHSPDPPVVTLDRLNPEEYVAAFQTAQLDHAMLYCKDHWGVTYYPTAVPGGKMHPGIAAGVAGGDLIGTMSRLLAEKGMGFIAYYSIGFDTRAATLHPDWSVRTESGEALRVGAKPPRKWHWVCKVSPYGDYALAQLGEIFERYKPELLFLDIYHQPFCYCQYCRQAFFERYGMLPPTGDDVTTYRRQVQDFRDDVYALAFLQKVVDLRNRVSPNTAVTINGGHSIIRRDVLDLCDMTYSEPWGSNWTSAMFARGTGVWPQIGPGNLGEVYDPPDVRIYTAELGSIVANGCRAFAFSGSQHTDGTLDRAEFVRLGTAFAPVREMQPYLEGTTAVPGLGILFSETSRLWGPDVTVREGLPTAPHTSSVDGSMTAATYSLWPADILPEWRLADDLSRYRALVAPNACCLSDASAERIREYVCGGGTLIATLDTGLLDENGGQRQDFALADVFGCHFRARHTEYGANRYGSYLQRQGANALWEAVADTLLPTAAPFIEVELTTGTSLATHVLPTVALTDSQWVNWWSPPPRVSTDYPAVVANRFGAGQVLYFSFDLLAMVKQGYLWPQKAFVSALGMLAGDPPLQVRAPLRGSVLASYMRQEGEHRLVVHLVNATVRLLKGEVHEIAGNVLRLGAGFTPRRAATVWPQAQSLAIEQRDGGHEIALPPLGIHQVVTVDLG